MTERTSFIGGVVSFAAVILLSILSLDRVDDGFLSLLGITSSAVEAPAIAEDSAEAPVTGEVR